MKQKSVYTIITINFRIIQENVFTTNYQLKVVHRQTPLPTSTAWDRATYSFLMIFLFSLHRECPRKCLPVLATCFQVFSDCPIHSSSNRHNTSQIILKKMQSTQKKKRKYLTGHPEALITQAKIIYSSELFPSINASKYIVVMIMTRLCLIRTTIKMLRKKEKNNKNNKRV